MYRYNCGCLKFPNSKPHTLSWCSWPLAIKTVYLMASGIFGEPQMMHPWLPEDTHWISWGMFSLDLHSFPGLVFCEFSIMGEPPGPMPISEQGDGKSLGNSFHKWLISRSPGLQQSPSQKKTAEFFGNKRSHQILAVSIVKPSFSSNIIRVTRTLNPKREGISYIIMIPVTQVWICH